MTRHTSPQTLLWASWQRSVRAAAIPMAFVLLGACSGGGGSTASAEAFCAAVTQVELSAQGYQELAEVTPDPVRADVERFAAALAGLEADGGDQSEGGAISDPAAQESLQRIGNDVTEQCGIGGEGESASDTGETEPRSGPVNPQPTGPSPTTAASSPDGPTPTTARTGSGDAEGEDSGSTREEPAVPPDEVKAEMREIFGDRLWGTSSGYFAPDGSEYEGNVHQLREAEALSACEELSAFVAEHPEMEGRGVVRLTDITVNADNEVVTNPIAVNETIGAGDPGSCRAAE